MQHPDEKNLKKFSLSTYKEQKRGENAKDWENNLKKIVPLLI